MHLGGCLCYNNNITMLVIHIIVKRFLLTLITASFAIHSFEENFSASFSLGSFSWSQWIVYEPYIVALYCVRTCLIYIFTCFPPNEEFQCIVVCNGVYQKVYLVLSHLVATGIIISIYTRLLYIFVFKFGFF